MTPTNSSAPFLGVRSPTQNLAPRSCQSSQVLSSSHSSSSNYNTMAYDNPCNTILDGLPFSLKHNKNKNKSQFTQQSRSKQLSILSFLNPKFLTPPTQTIAPTTQMATPVKAIRSHCSLHHDITPVALAFSPESVLITATEAIPLPTPCSPSSTLLSHTKQTKITQFFTRLHTRIKLRSNPVPITNPPPTTPITKKNAIRQNLFFTKTLDSTTSTIQLPVPQTKSNPIASSCKRNAIRQNY
jgi:hypothetical protein